MEGELLGIILGAKFAVYLCVFVYAVILIEIEQMRELFPMILMGIGFLAAVSVEAFHALGEIEPVLNVMCHETASDLVGMFIFIGGLGLGNTLLLINRNIEKFR